MKVDTYTPPQKILEKYARVLVRFALGKGKGIKKGDVVRVTGWDVATPLLLEIRKAIILAGGHAIMNVVFADDGRYGQSRDLVEYGSKEQLEFFPKKYMQELVNCMDHEIIIISDNPHAFSGVDAKKLMSVYNARAEYMRMRTEKDTKGDLTWTIAMYANQQLAREAGMSVKEYWAQIENACFLKEEDPIKKWKETFKELERVRRKLTDLKIEKVHVVGPDVDLVVGIGANRTWMAGGGANIPSYEVFCSPDYRMTEGHIHFNQPLYYQGTKITGISLVFKKGIIVKATAKTNQNVLRSMIAQKNANRIGEFSLTDSRISRITKFMANTLFDENMGGRFGNTHIAVGNAYRSGLRGTVASISEQQWDELGFNTSSVHTDMFSTTDRTVTATLSNGKEVVIYADGKFTV